MRVQKWILTLMNKMAFLQCLSLGALADVVARLFPRWGKVYTLCEFSCGSNFVWFSLQIWVADSLCFFSNSSCGIHDTQQWHQCGIVKCSTDTDSTFQECITHDSSFCFFSPTFYDFLIGINHIFSNFYFLFFRYGFCGLNAVTYARLSRWLNVSGVWCDLRRISTNMPALVQDAIELPAFGDPLPQRGAGVGGTGTNTDATSTQVGQRSN